VHALKVSVSTEDIAPLILDFGIGGVNSKLQAPVALRRGRNVPVSVEYDAGRFTELVWTI
jgi:hypothetical protein